MSLYSLFLAGSNFFAPVICGFIAQYQGWRWVFYYPSIFLGVCFVFLFVFMEETNYERKTIGIVNDADAGTPKSTLSTALEGEERKVGKEADPESTSESVNQGHGQILAYKEKTMWQKMSILPMKKEKNTIFRRLWQALYFTSWPVIFYAGYDMTHNAWCRSRC
jgi:MFS family permease